MLPNMRQAVPLLMLLCALAAGAQSCPTNVFRDAPKPSTLRGTLVFHDDFRGWLGLSMDKPACGEDEIQLVSPDGKQDYRSLKSLRGCAAVVTGSIYKSPTGYYSAPLALSVLQITPDHSCKPHPVEPDFSQIPRRADVDRYSASITVNFKAGPVQVAVWRDDNKNHPLTPWQPYVSYSITGAIEVMWFGCIEPFQMTKAKQIAPRLKSIALGGMNESMTNAELDMERVNTITFKCARPSSSGPKK